MQCLTLLGLFFMMGRAADSYFCPVLGKIAKALHMSDEIAGMTILGTHFYSPLLFLSFSLRMMT